MTTVRPTSAKALIAAHLNHDCDRKVTLKPDGTVVFTETNGMITSWLPNGTSVRIENGAAHPKGDPKRCNSCHTVPATNPPPAPSDLPSDFKVDDWMSSVEKRLLDEIRICVNDDAAITEYLKQERTDAPTVYQRIDRRLAVLGRIIK
jgi:hypothetical protein